MRFCTSCGSELVAGSKFCRDCGAPAPAPASAPPVWGPPSTPPPGVPAPTYPAAPTYAAARVPFNPMTLLVGNWVAAGAAALVGLVVLLGVSAALVLLGNPPHTSVGDKLDIIVMVAAGAVGANQFVRAEGGGSEVHADSNSIPLFITLLAIGAAALVFRRMTRHHTSALATLGDAARAALLFAVPLFVLALVFRGGIGSFTGDYEIHEEDELEKLTFGASAPGALVMGFLVLFVALSLALLARSNGWGRRMSRIHRYVAAPLAGLAVLFAALPVLGALAWATVPTTADWGPETRDAWGDYKEEDGDVMDLVVWGIGSASNVGTAYLSLGTGGRVGAHGEGELEYGDDYSVEAGHWVRIGEVIDGPRNVPSSVLEQLDDDTLDEIIGEEFSNEVGDEADREWNQAVREEWPDPWGLWFAIPVSLLLLFGTTLLVARRGRRNGTTLASLGIWVGSLFVVMPLLAHWASTTGSADGEIDDVSFEGMLAGGVKGFDTLLIPLICLGFAALVALFTGAIDTSRFSGLQQAPTQPPVPPQQGWAPPAPPAQQGWAPPAPGSEPRH